MVSVTPKVGPAGLLQFPQPAGQASDISRTFYSAETGGIMFEDKEYLLQGGVIYTELDVEEMEEVVAPVVLVAD